jgi:hypothetical protein
VPFVRIEKGVPDSASAPITPGINLYRPSARWYGSVFVPSATCSRFQLGRASSRRSTSTRFVLTTIWLSKS